jgi:hypothetical protein
MRALVVCAVCACSFPEKHPGAGDAAPMADASPDAGGPFACAGQPFPTTAPAMITVSGTLTHILSGVIPNATLRGYLRSAPGMSVITATSDMNGNYSVTFPTGGMSVDGYIGVDAAGSDFATTAYPSRPFTANLTGPLFRTNASELMMIYSAVLATYSATKGTVFVQVLDCNGQPVPNATVNSNPAAAKVVYINQQAAFDTSLVETSSVGVATLFGLVGSSVTITAGSNNTGVVFHAQTIPVVASAFTEVAIQP